MEFEIYPAIDLRNGRVVRLIQGNPDKMTVYSFEPAKVAHNWIEAGAQWLHIVNLDGAFGENENRNRVALKTLLEVAKENAVKIQFGGGLRDLESIAEVLGLGIDRVILGTLAITKPDVLERAINRFGNEKIGVSLDVRNGRPQTHGWLKSASSSPIDVAQQLKGSGLKWLVFTDTQRDGLQTGINIDSTRTIAQQSNLNVIASGGAKSQEEILLLRKANLSGVILGKALYEGKIDLQKTISQLS